MLDPDIVAKHTVRRRRVRSRRRSTGMLTRPHELVALVRELRERGLSVRSVALELSLPLGDVTRLLEPSSILVPVRLKPALAEALAAEARRRGVQPRTLARRLVEIVVADRLFDAVLDSGA